MGRWAPGAFRSADPAPAVSSPPDPRPGNVSDSPLPFRLVFVAGSVERLADGCKCGTDSSGREGFAGQPAGGGGALDGGGRLGSPGGAGPGSDGGEGPGSDGGGPRPPGADLPRRPDGHPGCGVDDPTGGAEGGRERGATWGRSKGTHRRRRRRCGLGGGAMGGWDHPPDVREVPKGHGRLEIRELWLEESAERGLVWRRRMAGPASGLAG
jgi:hypothetical protein